MDWHTFELGGTEVRVPAPEGAEFERHDGVATWSPDRAAGFFSVGSGATPGFTADGLLAGARERGEEVSVESDERTAHPGRRVAYRVARSLPRRLEAGPDGRAVSVPERAWTEVSDLLFVNGGVRVGYRVDERATAVRETFARMLDAVEVVRRDA